MGLQLPGELISLLSILGYTWPEADEEKLLQMGGDWLSFAESFGQPIGDAHAGAQQVWSGNQGESITAFQQAWTDRDAPAACLEDGTTAANLVGAGLMVCAAIVLALKINVIVQLVMLAIEIAEAVATAIATFGASLLEIPIFKEITGFVIDQLIDLALNAILDG
jgi:hypothetical protein